jgi:hypothetical protein
MTDSNNDDPVQRLVSAIVGSNDAHVIALANRVLGSQIGGTSSSSVNSSSTNQADLSSIWRRIARKGPDLNAKEDVQRLYRLYERESQDPEIPPKMLAGK